MQDENDLDATLSNHDQPNVTDQTESYAANVQASTRIGNYKLLQKLGEGGMGEVWMAEQNEPVSRRVALKIIKPSKVDKNLIARFEAERQALAMMDHPNIAKVYDGGTSDQGLPYLVMELIHGIPFTKFCDEHKLSVRERLSLFIPICKAIQHAHQKGIIHRDIKPSNVLVAYGDGDDPISKVIDFGLAKSNEDAIQLTDKTVFTEFGSIVGTIQYMSPEQAVSNSLDVDTRTDIYSLGVMLYELLTGSTPVEQETIGKNALLHVLELIRENNPPRPSDRLSSNLKLASSVSLQRKIDPARLQQILRGELDWVVMKAIEKDRRRRYETANDFAEDLRRYLDNEAVIARPPSTWYRLSKFVRKNSGLVASILMIFAFLIIATGVSYRFALNAEQSKRDAFAQKTVANDLRGLAEAKTKEAIQQAKVILDEKIRANRNEEKAINERLKADQALEKSEALAARSNYFLAMSRWENGRAKEANAGLELIPTRYRNFEWYLARRRFRGGYMTLHDHSDSITSVDFSSDGTKVASCSYDGTIILWESVSGTEIKRFESDSRGVYDVTFSPDGTLLCTCGVREPIKIWDVKTGEEKSSLAGHSDSVHDVEFSPDGSEIISAGSDKTIRVWDVATGQELRTLRGHTDDVTCLAIDRCRNQIISGSNDRTIRIWDLSTGEEVNLLDAESGVLMSVACSPDGKFMVSSGNDSKGILKLWDAETGEVTRTLGVLETGENACVKFSPDSSRFVACNSDGSVTLFETTNGNKVSTFTGHFEYVSSVAFDPRGRKLVSGSWDGTIKFWNSASIDLSRSIANRSGDVSDIHFINDGKRVLTRGSRTPNGQAFSLWDIDTEKLIWFYGGHTGETTCSAMTPSGMKFVSGSSDGELKVWDSATGDILTTVNAHSQRVSNVDVSADGKRMVSASGDKTCKVWDTSSGALLQVFQGHSSGVSQVAFSPDGSHIASCGRDKKLKLWDAVGGTEVKTFSGFSDRFTAIAFSPDGSQIATGDSGRKIRLWNVTTGRLIRVLSGHENNVSHVEFNQDGTRLASSGFHSFKIWDAATGEELWHSACDGGTTVAFSPCGKRLVAADSNLLKIWDLSTGDEVIRLENPPNGHADQIGSVTESPDGSRIVTTSFNGKAKLWDTSSGTVIRNLEGHTGTIFGIRFDQKKQRIYAQCDDNDLVWDAKDGTLVEDEPWQDLHDSEPNLQHGRWLEPRGFSSLYIKSKFKNQPFEANFLRSHLKFNDAWHIQMGNKALKSREWYTASFHFAWLLKFNPQRTDFRKSLQLAFKELSRELDIRKIEVDPPALFSPTLKPIFMQL